MRNDKFERGMVVGEADEGRCRVNVICKGIFSQGRYLMRNALFRGLDVSNDVAAASFLSFITLDTSGRISEDEFIIYTGSSTNKFTPG